MATPAADGFVVTLGHDDHGRVIFGPRDATDETWHVRAGDAYAAVPELAERVGFDQADG